LDGPRVLSLAEFEAEAGRFDDTAATMSGVDTYCSSSDWILAARHAFHSSLKPRVFSGAAGYGALLADVQGSLGRTLFPMEASWCLACPLVGPEPVALAYMLRAYLLMNPAWDSLLLAGIEESAPLFHALLTAFAGDHRLYQGVTVSRLKADLGGGVDGYMSRRSASFRNNLRRALRRCHEAGVTFQVHRQAEAWEPHFARIMAVEQASWKGLSQQGVAEGAMRLFYERLMARQVPLGRSRWIFARLDNQDIGYLLGGVLGSTFRGYQFSFDESYRNLSLGNVLQYHMIQELCHEGIGTYDLGVEMDYKRAWGEHEQITTSLLIKR